jgi:hypothetical protein
MLRRGRALRLDDSSRINPMPAIVDALPSRVPEAIFRCAYYRARSDVITQHANTLTPPRRRDGVRSNRRAVYYPASWASRPRLQYPDGTEASATDPPTHEPAGQESHPASGTDSGNIRTLELACSRDGRGKVSYASHR